MMKDLIRSLLRRFNYELCRLSPEELETIEPGLFLNYKEAQVYRTLTAGGQISMVESRFLMELVKRSDASRPLVEIGALYGSSTLVMCLAKSPAQLLYSVDNFSWNSLGISSEAHFASTKRRLSECMRAYGVKLVNSPAETFYSQYDGPPPALFFCDADHSYEAVKKDISWAKSRRATIICGDDYEPCHQGVVRAVDEFGGPTELQGGLWVLKQEPEAC